MAYPNYVKFLRGTPAAYEALENKDHDTLYFIAATDATVGKLYLGNILVAGSVTPDGASIIDTLGELVDVKLTGLKTGDVLSYNGTDWVPMSLAGAISGSVMTGATAELPGKEGFVPAPKAGDQGKFLKGDGTWADVPLNDYALKTELAETNEDVSENTSAIAGLNDSLTWKAL